MTRLVLCSVAFLIVSSVGLAQPNGGAPGPVLGIVEIPKIFAIDPQTGERVDSGALTLYSRPDSDGKVATYVHSREAIDDAEYGYEEAGALVYRRQAGSYLIRTARGMAWLSPDDAGAFHPFETLISNNLTYLTDAWNGFVSASPGARERTRVPRPESGSLDVAVKGFRTVAGIRWLQVEVLSHSICESDAPPSIRARGWIPAHNDQGAPTVWFASRGC